MHYRITGLLQDKEGVIRKRDLTHTDAVSSSSVGLDDQNTIVTIQ